MRHADTGSPELLSLLDKIFNEIDKIKRTHGNETILKTKAKSTILANIFYYFNNDYSWEYASMLSTVIRSYTSSRIVLDLVSCGIASSPGGKGLENRLIAATELIGSKLSEVQQHCSGGMLVKSFDNSPTKARYCWKSSDAVSLNLCLNT